MKPLSCVLCLLCASFAHAATFTAATCSNTDVQTAINSASTGDTVVVPVGSCTWTSTVAIASKGITLSGAGIGSTNITDQGSPAALNITGASATNFVTVSGFTFIKSNSNNNGIVQIDGTQGTVAFRFHHLRFVFASSGSRGIGNVDVYGLIDHVTFDMTAPTGSIQSIAVHGSSDGTDGGYTPWMQALSLGTSNAVYIEDSTFNYCSGNQNEDSIDAYSGARLVVRHNIFNCVTQGFHGTDSGSLRSVFSYEIYSNTYTNNSGIQLRAATLRGGTGVVHDNTYGGSTAWINIMPMVYRGCAPLDHSTWGVCDGTNWQIGSTNFSSIDSRTTSTNGGVKFCSNHPDNVCTVDGDCPGGTCSRFFDGSGTNGYACRDQVGRTHDQALSALYSWNNGSVSITPGNGNNPSCDAQMNNLLQSGRDYNANVTMPGYVAYTYPNPLQVTTSSAGISGTIKITGTSVLH